MNGLDDVDVGDPAPVYLPDHLQEAAAPHQQQQPNRWTCNGFGAAAVVKNGKFSKAESEMVRKAVQEYCAAKQIEPSRLCSEADHKMKAELKGSWMEIAKRIPERSVQSVYRHGIRQLHPFKRGAWTEDETAQLAELVQRLGKKWSVIQSKLNRSAECCRDKYREMSDEYVKGRWKDSELELLRRLVREHLQADPNTDLRTLGKLVQEQGVQLPWSQISKRIGKRSRLSCFKKWQKMAGLLDQPSSRGRARKNPRDLEQQVQSAAKRAKSEPEDVAVGAAVAGAFDEEIAYQSAKMAEQTVEAVELPDVNVGGVNVNVREI